MWELYEGDCLEIMPTLPCQSVNLVFADPPYNIGKADWDKIDNYLEWCEKWVAECSRLLKPNGAFWVSHIDPDALVEISRMITRHGRPRVNWITWDKYNGNPFAQAAGTSLRSKTNYSFLRSFQGMAEYLVYHAADPMPDYLRICRERAGLTRNEVDLACGNVRKRGLYVGRGTDLCYRWEAGDCLPTEEQYAKLMKIIGCTKPYAELKADYEAMRYVFHNPGGVSSVWQCAPAPRNGHPTPKPEPLLERIIATCTNPGDTVLDPFAGSGTTLCVAERLGRNSIGIELSAEYCAIIRRRMAEVQPALPLAR